jgi:hypothetical protein
MRKKIKIVITYSDLDKYYEVFEKMDVKANEFCPTTEELYQLIVPKIYDYILFLLWIDETGIETEENKQDRLNVRKIIKEYLTVCDEKDLGKELKNNTKGKL